MQLVQLNNGDDNLLLFYLRRCQYIFEGLQNYTKDNQIRNKDYLMEIVHATDTVLPCKQRVALKLIVSTK